MAGYRLSKRFTRKDRAQVLKQITRDLKAGKTSGQIIKGLRDKGLGYQDSKMYHDIRRKESSYQAKTPDARQRALRWFDKVYEPFREKNKLSSIQASRQWNRTVTQSYETVEQAEQGSELWQAFRDLYA